MRRYCKAILCLLLLSSPALPQQPASPSPSNGRTETDLGVSAGQHRPPSMTTDDAYERRMPPKDLQAITRISLVVARNRGAKETLILTPADGEITASAVGFSRDGGSDILEIQFNGQNTQWVIAFSTRGLKRNIVPGNYTRCGDVHSTGTAGINIRGNRYSAFTTDGSFNIYDLQINHSPESGFPPVTSFAASFRATSNDGEVSGVIYINAVPINGLR